MTPPPPPAFPLPGQFRVPMDSSPPLNLDPDEVGYTQAPVQRGKTASHTPDQCQREHCACHLPFTFNPPPLELSGREALALAWHLFPLGDDDDLSFEEIGAKLGITSARVKQIYSHVGAKLRGYPRGHYPPKPPKPGTPEYEKRMAAAADYRAEHPEYAQTRALIEVLNQAAPENGADS